MKAIWGWSLAVIGATGICHATDDDPVAGIVSRISGGWQDAKHSRVLERGSDVLQNASIMRTDPPAPDAQIEIYLLNGQVISRNCATGACANPIEVKSSEQDARDLLKIIKELLFSPEEQPVPAATMAASSGLMPARSAALSETRVAPAFAAGVVSRSGTITDVVLSREPPSDKILGGALSAMVGSSRRPNWPVTDMARVSPPAPGTSAPSVAKVCGGSRAALALCDGQDAAPGTYYGRGWLIYLFESEAQVKCVSGAMKVGDLLAHWQARTDDSSNAERLGVKAKGYVDARAEVCRR